MKAITLTLIATLLTLTAIRMTFGVVEYQAKHFANVMIIIQDDDNEDAVESVSTVAMIKDYRGAK